MPSSVSVVIPTIPPRHELLQRALKSVQAQTRPPDAVIVTLDSDGNGAAPTRNEGLAAVETEFVAFLDDDDILLPRHLEALLSCAEETGADLVYPWFRGPNASIFHVPDVDGVGYVNPEHRAWDGLLEAFLREEGNFIPITVLARTEVVRAAGGFANHPNSDDFGATCEDWSMWVKMLDVGAKFVHLDEATWLWPNHGGHTAGHSWIDIYRRP